MTDFFSIFRDNRLSLLFKESPNLCFRAVTLIRLPSSIDHFLSSGVFRKLAVSTVLCCVFNNHHDPCFTVLKYLQQSCLA